jgi:hypothetical protein
MLDKEDVSLIVRARQAAIELWKIKQRDGVVPPRELSSVATSYSVTTFAIMRELERMGCLASGTAMAIEKRCFGNNNVFQSKENNHE